MGGMVASSRLNPSACPRILQLPLKVAESIVVLCDNPSTLASLAQTCSFFRSLLYVPGDSHLWRTLYLWDFDNPRGSRHLRLRNDTFDWGVEYRQRAWALWLMRSSNSIKAYLNTHRPSPSSLSSRLTSRRRGPTCQGQGDPFIVSLCPTSYWNRSLTEGHISCIFYTHCLPQTSTNGSPTTSSLS